MTALRQTEDAWATVQVQEALSVLSADAARRWEDSREREEAEARQRMADWLALADGRDQRARMYASWADEYPASHRFHQRYAAMAAEQRRLKDDAMRMFRQERSRL